MKSHLRVPADVVLANEEQIAESQRWLGHHGVDAMPRDYFPPTTYVVPGVAMQSLYLTDSSLAFLESMIGNPALSKADRSAGLDAVITRAIDEARAAGTRVLCGYVQSPAVEERLRRHGFRVFGRNLSFIAMSFNNEEK